MAMSVCLWASFISLLSTTLIFCSNYDHMSFINLSLSLKVVLVSFSCYSCVELISSIFTLKSPKVRYRYLTSSKSSSAWFLVTSISLFIFFISTIVFLLSSLISCFNLSLRSRLSLESLLLFISNYFSWSLIPLSNNILASFKFLSCLSLIFLSRSRKSFVISFVYCSKYSLRFLHFPFSSVPKRPGTIKFSAYICFIFSWDSWWFWLTRLLRLSYT